MLFRAIDIQFVQRAPLLPLGSGRLASAALETTGAPRCAGWAEVGVSSGCTKGFERLKLPSGPDHLSTQSGLGVSQHKGCTLTLPTDVC
ncbi:hypothetical protein CgunFtcFv8_009624 [Champsocephalus gunnari]|uniref:Uncharacterized protein n=1 Tax=Champsocephalus gunnari TaxID=52237 RepID=A0AAN8GYU2_CHAGU|nr:hypothetical protein CgunFtcFv8_009624 [Champsocephalus gunnari]